MGGVGTGRTQNDGFEQYPSGIAKAGGLVAGTTPGLRIPQDVGIVGFDNVPESPFFGPPLSSVNHDQFDLGKVAVEEIIKIIESGWEEGTSIPSKSIMLEPTLVVRDSSLRLKV